MHVYVISRASDGLVKVGRSITPDVRLRTLETQGGFHIARAWVSVPLDDSITTESLAHLALQESRDIGEWFAVDFDEAVAAVCEAVAGIDMPSFDTWTKNARAIANKRGITIAQIAQSMGVTPGCVGHWLSGRRTASVEEAEQIAAALGVTLNDLLPQPPAEMADVVTPVERAPQTTASEFATRVKQARRASGLTQVQLSAAVGITRQSIAFLESGRAEVSKHLFPLADALGVTPRWLATGIGPMRNDERDPFADLLATLTPAQRAQALRMLEAFAASCAQEGTE